MSNKRWIASWTAAPMNVWGPDAPLSAFYGQTIREFARLSVGGEALMLRLSNEFGSAPLHIEAMEIGLAGERGRVQPRTGRPVTFAGRRAATIAPGAPLVSDPVPLPVEPLSRVCVSYYSSGHIPVATYHYEAQQTCFISVPGNFLGAETMIVQQTTTSRYLVSALYALTDAAAGAVVCFGDSLTDGYGSTIDGDSRWPDQLAERLQQAPGPCRMAVLNQGIGGNRLLHSRRGAKGIERFDRDVLSFAGVSHLIILEGMNDIVWPHTVLAGPEEAVGSDEVIAALGQLVARARLAGIEVLLGTLMPFEGSQPHFPNGGYFTPKKERLRQEVNHWIRHSSNVRHVDFDAITRDPSHFARLRPDYDFGDHVHLTDSGYRAMADAIDLDWLTN